MRVIGKSLLVGASVLSLTVPAFAQDAPASTGAGFNSGEIVVQARRRDESVQDVPVVVNAVTSEDLAKLNIRQFDDITSVVPGLNLSPNSSGIGGGISTVRGVNFDVYSSGSNGTVEFYMNDAPVPSGVVYQAMYDIGQIEVLRGPQGTLRGRASPSGSITVTTRKPDLDAVGGYVMGTVNDLDGHNFNGAVNVPIIAGKLGIRVAGLVSQDEGNRVTPVGGNFTPKDDTKSLRASISADPFDGALLLDFSYLTLNRKSNQYDQVESLDQVITDGSVAASPVTIRAKDRNAYRGLSYPFDQQFRNYNWQARLSQWGQQLTYVGNRYEQDIISKEPMDKAGIFADPSFGGKGFHQTANNSSQYDSHELRLQNEERLFDMFDYVVGAMSYKANTPTALDRLFSASATTPPNPVLTNATFGEFYRYSSTKEESIYGNLTVHFGQGTEISGGLRKIWYEHASGALIGGAEVEQLTRSGSEGKLIYTASVKHRFNDALMVYASTGSSWRPSISAVGGPTAGASELQDSFINLPAETSKSYEVGIKSNWLDDRLTVNFTAYHQKFDNYPYRSGGLGVYAIDRSNPAAPLVKQFNYVAAVPVKVKGFEFEVAGRPTDNWDMAASVAYADGKISNGIIPCLDLNNDGVPDTVLTAPTLPEMEGAVGADNIGTCNANYRSSNSSPWSASIQSEYSMAVNDNTEAYLRGLFSWKGNSIGDPGNAFDSVSSYGLLNAYIGVRDADGGWDITAYAKNLTNAFRVLTRSNGPLSTSLRSPGTLSYTNYFGVSVTEPREFGVTARFAFGSR